MMRITGFVLAVMFLAFSFVQINDPDPLIWIMIYGSMAVVSVMAAFSYYPRKFLIGLLVVFAAYSIMYFDGVREWLKQDDKSALFDEVAKMEHLYIEEAREFLGLVICMVVIVVYRVKSRKLAKN